MWVDVHMELTDVSGLDEMLTDVEATEVSREMGPNGNPVINFRLYVDTPEDFDKLVKACAYYDEDNTSQWNHT